jgi:hypothetical protein
MRADVLIFIYISVNKFRERRKEYDTFQPQIDSFW